MATVVGVSTLHGNIIKVGVTPDMLVGKIKAKIMEHTPMTTSPLNINADWADIMSPCAIDDLIGIRLCTFDGDMLQDDRRLGSQVADINTFYKVVFMKQYDLTPDDNALLMEFANLPLGINEVAKKMSNGSIFYIVPVWGDHAQANHIKGLLFQHGHTAKQCFLMSMGMDPKTPCDMLPPCDKLIGDW